MRVTRKKRGEPRSWQVVESSVVERGNMTVIVRACDSSKRRGAVCQSGGLLPGGMGWGFLTWGDVVMGQGCH
ncbi:hypothetical protein XELAEV_18005519mg [Xenopus laevis]|uniref:Uncharacterized protein n=1 Tax=Xenopus laevis TaxID=8355 RepID=A0A974I3B0_XENLA|nr:hypothetical protein XELAEV_18005519mg [Xenopus laevis]